MAAEATRISERNSPCQEPLRITPKLWRAHLIATQVDSRQEVLWSSGQDGSEGRDKQLSDLQPFWFIGNGLKGMGQEEEGHWLPRLPGCKLHRVIVCICLGCRHCPKSHALHFLRCLSDRRACPQADISENIMMRHRCPWQGMQEGDVLLQDCTQRHGQRIWLTKKALPCQACCQL